MVERASGGLAAAPERDASRKLTFSVDGEVAGFIQFIEGPDPDARHADIDIFLGPDCRDRGLGTEAIRVLVGHLIEDRGHHPITLTSSTATERAIYAYEKVGLRRVGVLSKAHRRRATGEWEEELLMELVV